MEKQKTIKAPVSLSGIGLHTGNVVRVSLKPAEENTGIKFIRLDLPQRPVIKADLSNIITDPSVVRCTALGQNGVVIYTVEHLMSVLGGLGIDNLTIELDNNELPALDGSGLGFLEAIEKVGLQEQNAIRKYFQIVEPIGVQNQEACIYVSPSDEFKIFYTLDYNHQLLSSQFLSITLNPQIYGREIAPSRTFCLEDEAKELQKRGLGKGADYTNTLVVGEKGVIKNEVRFKDEFVRHKVLDFIGDIYLLGVPLKAQIFAVKSGHRLNFELLKKIHKQKTDYENRDFVPSYDWGGKKEYNIQDIMRILPHRYPFLMVDRVIEIEKGKKAVGIKNVTINDNFFQGHFPTKAIMPGVLMIEAMAQAAGVVVLTNEEHRGKVAFFMSADNVKFRKVVIPGDQLLMEVEVVSNKSKTAKIHAQAKVGEDIVAEADMLFSFTEASYLS